LPHNEHEQLHTQLLAAHSCGDRPGMLRLYGRAGDLAHADGQINAACFFWTQAYIFALELGDNRAEILRDRLREHGREE